MPFPIRIIWDTFSRVKFVCKKIVVIECNKLNWPLKLQKEFIKVEFVCKNTNKVRTDLIAKRQRTKLFTKRQSIAKNDAINIFKYFSRFLRKIKLVFSMSNYPYDGQVTKTVFSVNKNNQ